ncbi:MAG: hypothetical protein AAF722_12705 [Cyanobacteria bacterium P01_C01_bin.70]
MRSVNRYDSRDEVKVAVITDEMRIDESFRGPALDVVCGCIALIATCILFLTVQ